METINTWLFETDLSKLLFFSGNQNLMATNVQNWLWDNKQNIVVLVNLLISVNTFPIAEQKRRHASSLFGTVAELLCSDYMTECFKSESSI